MPRHNSQNVINRRRRIKQHIIKGFGGSCGICNYDKSVAALEFHHLDPNEKEFHMGGYQSTSWPRLVEEMKKCVMLCCRCHREVHAGITDIPKDIQRLDESKTGYIPKRNPGGRIGTPSRTQTEVSSLKRRAH